MQDTLLGAAGGFLAGILLLSPGATNTTTPDATNPRSAERAIRAATQTASGDESSEQDTPSNTQDDTKADVLNGAELSRKPAVPAMHEADLSDPVFVDAVLAVAEDIDPELGKRLHHACGNDQRKFQQAVKNAGRHLIGLAQLKLNDPELYKLKIAEMKWEPEALELARDWHEAVAAGNRERAAELNEQLNTAVATHLVLIIKARGEYILRLEKYLERLKEQLNRDGENFDEHIERRVEKLKQRVKKEHALATDQ